MKLDNNGIRLRIDREFGSRVLGFFEFRSLLSVDINGVDVEQFSSFLLRELNFALLVDITAVDYSDYVVSEGIEGRFGVIYIFYSFEHDARIKLRAFVGGSVPSLPSIYNSYKGALWTEREVYDMYGIEFRGHPGLKRLLMPDSFKDYPLRKDYPLQGRGERSSFPKYNIYNRSKNRSKED